MKNFRAMIVGCGMLAGCASLPEGNPAWALGSKGKLVTVGENTYKVVKSVEKQNTYYAIDTKAVRTSLPDRVFFRNGIVAIEKATDCRVVDSFPINMGLIIETLVSC